MDDLSAEALVKLLAALRKWKVRQAQPDADNFQFYVYAVARNVCHDYLRESYPQMRALQDQLRYWFKLNPDLAIWKNEHGQRLCGHGSWQNDGRGVVSPEQWQRIVENYEVKKSGAKRQLKDLISPVLSQAAAPVAFSALVSLAANWLGVRQEKPATELNEGELNQFAQAVEEPVDELEQRQYLQHVWQSIGQLSASQRRALLLNLHNGSDRGLIVSFVDLGLATIPKLASVLDMPLDDFLSLWAELPLDDEDIARLFGMTRQQVINLRFSARKRLVTLLG